MTVNEYGIDLKIILTSNDNKFRAAMRRMINNILYNNNKYRRTSKVKQNIGILKKVHLEQDFEQWVIYCYFIK